MSRRKAALLMLVAAGLFVLIYVAHSWFWLLVLSWLLSIASV